MRESSLGTWVVVGTILFVIPSVLLSYMGEHDFSRFFCGGAIGFWIGFYMGKTD